MVQIHVREGHPGIHGHEKTLRGRYSLTDESRHRVDIVATDHRDLRPAILHKLFVALSQIAHSSNRPRFPHRGLWPEGSHHAGIGPGVDAQQLPGHRGREMHRPTIDAHGKRRTPHQPKELEQRSLISQVNRVARKFHTILLGSHAHDNNPSRSQCFTKLHAMCRAKCLPAPP